MLQGGSIMAAIVTIFLLFLLFEAGAFVLKLSGKIVWSMLSIAGVLVAGGLLIGVLGVSLIFLPVLMIIGLVLFLAAV